MADLARALGLVKHAVSLALAGKPGVSEATRAAVRQAARDLGHPVRTSVRPPVRDRVALVVLRTRLHRPAGYIFGALLDAFLPELSHQNAPTLFSRAPDAAERVRVPDPVAEGE